jgi:hypothetical protein
MTSLPPTIVRSEPRHGPVVGTGEVHLPTVIERAGERACRRFVEFFTAVYPSSSPPTSRSSRPRSPSPWLDPINGHSVDSAVVDQANESLSHLRS